jgi:hypothetical protein
VGRQGDGDGKSYPLDYMGLMMSEQKVGWQESAKLLALASA